MTMKLMRQAVRLYSSPYVSRETNRWNRRQWLRSVQELGDKWVYNGGPAKWGYRTNQQRSL